MNKKKIFFCFLSTTDATSVSFKISFSYANTNLQKKYILLHEQLLISKYYAILPVLSHSQSHAHVLGFHI